MKIRDSMFDICKIPIDPGVFSLREYSQGQQHHRFQWENSVVLEVGG